MHKNYSLILLDLIVTQYQLIDNPIIFHTFSNAGLFLYRYFSEIINENEKYSFLKKNIKALISDSGPGWTVDYLKFLANLTELMEDQIKFKPLRYLVASGALAVFLLKNRIIFNSENYFKLFLQALVDDKLCVPTLIFYSKTDRLISWNYILDYAEKRRKAKPGIKIKTIEFFNTEHVSNYLKYPKIYYENLRNHIAEQNVQIYDDNDFSAKLPQVKSQL